MIDTYELSICIPFCNKDENLLPHILDDVVSKVLCSYEVILVDNRKEIGTDIFATYLDNYIPKIDIKLIQNPNIDKDLLSARIVAINNASGKYCWLVDVDDGLVDTILPGRLKQYNEDIICFNFIAKYIKNNQSANVINNGIYNIIQKEEPMNFMPVGIWDSSILHGIPVQVWCKFFRLNFIREVLNKYKFNSITSMEDYVIFYSTFSNTMSIRFLPDTFYLYDTSASKTFGEIKSIDDFKFNALHTKNALSFLKMLSQEKPDIVNYEGIKIENRRWTLSRLLESDIDAADVEKCLDIVKQNLLIENGDIAEILFSETANARYYLKSNNLPIVCKLIDISYSRLVEIYKRNAFGVTPSDYMPVHFIEYAYKDNIIHLRKQNNLHKFKSHTDCTLSFCITCYDGDYNNVNTIIDSIKKRAVANDYEIVVVNNCVNNSLEKLEGITYIDTNENVLPYYSRLLGAQAAKGDYIWYIDGDDSISFNKNLMHLLASAECDIYLFNNNIHLQSILELDGIDATIDYFRANKVNRTLHNIIMSKSIYKHFTDLPKYKIYFFEDTFYFYYSLLFAESVYLSDGIISYSHEHDHMHFINYTGTDFLNLFIVGQENLFNLISSNFSEVSSKHIINEYIFTLSEGINKTYNIANKELIASKMPYWPVKESIVDYSNTKFTSIYSSNKNVDIIYFYYGKNFNSEISNLKEKILCNYNLIIANPLNLNIDNVDNYKIVKGTNIKEIFTNAISLLETDNVLILESYKKIYYFNGIFINNKTTVVYDNKLLEFFPLVRNNTVFIKNDFINFVDDLDDNSSLSTLSIDINNFLTGITSIKLNGYISTVNLFDESDINIYLFNFDNYLDKSYLAKLGYNSIKAAFPKANITIFTEQTAKNLIDQNDLVKKIISLRDKAELKNYENDILRLLAVQQNKKALYLDLDIIIKDKNAILKALSIYPNWCPHEIRTYQYCPQIHNEITWSLDNSKFINENIKFYDQYVNEKNLNENNLLYNCAIAEKLQYKYGYQGSTNGDFIITLDMWSSKVCDDYYIHLYNSRFDIKHYKDTDIIAVCSHYSIYNRLDELSVHLEESLKLNGIKVLFNIMPAYKTYAYHQLKNGIEITDLPRYVTDETSIQILKKVLLEKGYNIKYIYNYDTNEMINIDDIA